MNQWSGGLTVRREPAVIGDLKITDCIERTLITMKYKQPKKKTLLNYPAELRGLPNNRYGGVPDYLTPNLSSAVTLEFAW